jgi:hydrogenase small subunit
MATAKKFPHNSGSGKPLAGLSRRQFIKFCGCVAAALGVPVSMAPKIARAIEQRGRLPVVWLSFQGCTGCTESLLRSTHPTLEKLLFEIISLEYHETLNAGAGIQAEAALKETLNRDAGRFVLVAEGSIPVADKGVYVRINEQAGVDLLNEVAPKALAVIAIGSCASWGGIPSSGPNPTGAKSVGSILEGRPVVNITGCPPNPYNFLETVLYFATFGKLPELDAHNRPKFAYGRLIHENCERRPHFDAGRFAKAFGDDGHKKGFCLYKLGCKGPETFANCQVVKFGDVEASPISIGHPCFGCTESGVGFKKPMFQSADIQRFTPPAFYPRVFESRGEGVTPLTAAFGGAAFGGAIGAGYALANRLFKVTDGKEGADKPEGGGAHEDE